MKRLVLLLVFASCGAENNQPTTGSFQVEQRVVSDTCGSYTPALQVWEIIEQKGGGFSILVFGQGKESAIDKGVLAVSEDGYAFYSSSPNVVLGCSFAVELKIELEYNDAGFTGISSLTSPAACGMSACETILNLKGQPALVGGI